MASTAPRRWRASATSGSTSSSSAAGSPARAWRSTPPAAACAPRWSSGTTSRPALVEVARSSCTAACATCSSGEVRLVYEALHERQRLRAQRAPPRAGAAVPAPGLHRGTGVIDRRSSPGRSAPRCGCTTSPAALRIGKLPQAHLEPTRRWRTCRRCPPTGSPRAYLYYDAQADDARLTLTIARTAADRTARSSPTTRAVAGLDKDARRPRRRRARRGRRRRDRRARPGRRERDRRVVRRRARARRGHAPATRSGRPRASTSPCRGRKVRNDIAAVIPVPKDRRSVFVVPWGDTHLHRHHRHRLRRPARRPAVHARRRRLPARRDQRASPTTELTEADIARHVGRAAARSCAAADERAHRRPVAPPLGAHVAERRGHRHRRQAHDLPAHGGRHGRRGASRSLGARGRPSRTKHLRLLGGEGLAPPVAALEPSAHEHLAGRYGSEAAAVLALVADDPTLGEAARARPALPRAPRRVYAVRHEMARTVDDVLVAAHPGPAAGPRRVGGRGRRRGRRSSPPSSAGRRRNATRQVAGVPRR